MSVPNQPLKLAPYLSPRPWGGRRLEAYGKRLPEGRIGEAWELSDHPAGVSHVAEGPHAGRPFGELVREFPRAMCGRERPPDRFPLLVKYIDASEDLSIQVHPDDAYALPRKDRGKAECWYVIDCPEDAEVVLGLARGADVEAFRRALRGASSNGRAHSGRPAVDGPAIERLVARRPIRPGMFLSIPPGTVHALLAGTIVCEIQQTSDQTYRIWDWGRDRELHAEDALAVARLHEADDSLVQDTGPIGRDEYSAGAERELVSNEHFRVSLLSLPPRASLLEWRPQNVSGLVVNVVAGDAEWRGPVGGAHGALRTGDTWYLPVAADEALGLRAGEAGLRLVLSRPLGA